MPVAAFHLLPGASTSDLTWAATGAQLVKLCDASLIAPAQALGAKVIYRPYLPDDGNCDDGTAWADRVIAEIHNTRTPWPEYFGFRNEMSATAANVTAYQSYRTVLRQAGYRGIVLFGSFSVGVPDWPEWEAMRQAWGSDRPDAVELHEYFDLTVGGSAPWYALRCIEAIKRGYLPPDMPFLIGEFGSDALGVEDRQKRGGWRTKMRDIDAGYQLLDYLTALEGTACMGVCWFTDGQNPGQWGDYTTRGTAVETAIRATWARVGAQTIPISPPPAQPPQVPVQPLWTPPPLPTRKARLMTVTDYCTQIDPQGSGENRCGAGVGASGQCTLVPGDYDNYQLMRAWTAKINDVRLAANRPGNIFTYGTDSQDIIDAAPSFGLKGRMWTPMSDAEAAWKAGEVVLALVRNQLVRPRLYPDAPGWTEHADGTPIQHWVRIDPLTYHGKVDGAYLLIMDPLCYLPENGAPYQGPACVTRGSVADAIANTNAVEAGVILSVA